MPRYNCTKEGMGGSFKCISYGSIHLNAGTCTKTEDCEHKELDFRDREAES